MPKIVSSVTIRYNEIGLSSAKPRSTENVLRGEVVSRDYRGAVTDHDVRVGNANITGSAVLSRVLQ